MNTTGNGQLIVIDNGQLTGVVTLKDMLRFLSFKLDLEGTRTSHMPEGALIDQ